MNLKKVLSISFAIFSLSFSFGQTLQTYKGVFESGTATYQYFENEKSDRIYDGTFNYIGNPYTFTGKFSKNLRTGKWKISALNKTYKNEKGKIQITTGITGVYKAGKMDSTWNYTNAIKSYNPKTKKLNPKAEITKATALFRDNHFAGKIYFEKGTTTKTVTTGQFDENGFPDGIWIIKSPKESEELKYNKGVLMSRIVKDIATGDKKANEDFSGSIAKFWASYDPSKQIGTVDGKMYFIDTVEFQNTATMIWQKDVISHDLLGNIINPLYAYKRSQTAPSAYQVVLIECDGNTDCFSTYMKEKNAEIERQNQLQAEEAERLRQETLAKEEQIRIEKEKELERQRQEQLANAERIGDEFLKQKKYANAINQYNEVNRLSNSEKVNDKINEAIQGMRFVDSMHMVLSNNYLTLKNNVGPTFEKAYALQTAVKAKKKAYGTNYVLCIDYLKTNFMPQFETLAYMDKTNTGVKEFWTDANLKTLEEIKILSNQLEDVNKFYNAVNEALTTNNKTKLRILNSSLNPKTIIYDMMNVNLK